MNFNKRFFLYVSSFLIMFHAYSVAASTANGAASLLEYPKDPPFKLTKLKPSDNSKGYYDPLNLYNIFVNYELGMHCVGFDMSYCCVIPPYNSIQAQAVRSGRGGDTPRLLSPFDGVKLYYYTKDNSYSEGNKMRYWSVAKDVDGDGHLDSPGDNMANYVWTHLFIYKDLEGTLLPKPKESDRLRVGKQIRVRYDSGPSGKPMAGGYMDYADRDGSNVVFTDTLVPAVKDVPLTLTASYIWDALGLPLTAFNDSRRRGTIRSVTESDFQPYQYSAVQLRTSDGKPILDANKRVIEYFGTNPVDIPNCYACHSREGKAAQMAREEGLTYSDKEYAYWKSYPDTSEYMARLAEASINILSLHDAHHGTKFLADYKEDAPGNRLGRSGPVNCADCHGDNISGNLQSPRPTATGYKAVKAKPLTEAIHGFHLAMVPMPDAAGRSQSCQACHPTHFQDPSMNDDTNPFRVFDRYGKARFSNKDVRESGGGCYVRRDAHSNPDVEPPFFLNEYGKYLLREVSMKDEKGRSIKRIRGLYCTNCHNKIAQTFYVTDNLKEAQTLSGKTLRNRSLDEIVAVMTGGDIKRFNELADPKSTGANEVLKFYTEHKSATLVKSVAAKGLDLKPWNSKEGKAIPYSAVSGGSDWWLSASEPHCADCHLAPFVESMGGDYFPIDQPNKLSLYRYSKAHGDIACQSCHESIHGLYPSRYDGPKHTVDLTTREQALQYSPDGEYAGPVTCAACHTVNSKGVPKELAGTKYEKDYWASVTLAHFMRSGDQKLSIKELVEKYPYERSKEVVQKGWE
ncbi:MAG: cytochrome c3 family protein [Hydrogenimonas sp.]|nr:cytochrome c3 family protein [Hydrogenimonas sp.]